MIIKRETHIDCEACNVAYKALHTFATKRNATVEGDMYVIQSVIYDVPGWVYWRSRIRLNDGRVKRVYAYHKEDAQHESEVRWRYA